MTLAVLIADAATDVGLGHVSRCSALAVALKREGVAIRAFGLELRAPLTRHGVQWEPADLPDLTGANAVVLDSYRATRDVRADLGSSAPLIAFIDDDRSLPDAALVVRSGSGSQGDLTGPRYACLGPEFGSPRPARVRKSVKLILVTTGGADRSGLGSVLAERLMRMHRTSEVLLVRGPNSVSPQVSHRVRVLTAPESLLDALVAADLAVCTGGVSMLEAVAVGTPCVALISADNQRRQAEELRRLGAVTTADSVEQATDAVHDLARNLEARVRQAQAGQRAVDGRGAMRVAAAVLAVIRASDEALPDVRSDLVLRPVGLSDATFLLELRNDPLTRRSSFSHHEISHDEHMSWLVAQLSDPGARLWIAVHGDRPAGHLRLQRLDERTAEVHLAVAAEFRNQGFARDMLSQAVDLCRDSWPGISTLRGRILSCNVSSLRAFRAASFAEVESSADHVTIVERSVDGGDSRM